MIDRCHTDKGVFIPGCMGGAVYGRRGCTCPPKRSTPLGDDHSPAMVKRLLKRVALVEARLAHAERSLQDATAPAAGTGAGEVA